MNNGNYCISYSEPDRIKTSIWKWSHFIGSLCMTQNQDNVLLDYIRTQTVK